MEWKMNDTEFEYGVKHHHYPAELWRGPWSYDKAVEWIRSAERDGIEDVFYLVRRPRADNWEKVENE
jgi:hypothetical protein